MVLVRVYPDPRRRHTLHENAEMRDGHNVRVPTCVLGNFNVQVCHSWEIKTLLLFLRGSFSRLRPVRDYRIVPNGSRLNSDFTQSRTFFQMNRNGTSLGPSVLHPVDRYMARFAHVE